MASMHWSQAKIPLESSCNGGFVVPQPPQWGESSGTNPRFARRKAHWVEVPSASYEFGLGEEPVADAKQKAMTVEAAAGSG